MDPLKEGEYYHIYNRGAGKCAMFIYHNDYLFFTNQFFYYLFPAAKIYAWCLMKNHFHALIKIRTIEEQIEIYERHRFKYEQNTFHGVMSPCLKPYNFSRQIGHLFNKYTKYFNKKYDPSGTLIESAVKRKAISSDSNLIHVLCYIHRNPIHHKVTKSYEAYPYSSFRSYLSRKNEFIDYSEMVTLLGGFKNYISSHNEFKLAIESEFYLE